MENHKRNVFLAVFIGIVLGAALMIAISTVVGRQTDSLSLRLDQVLEGQVALQKNVADLQESVRLARLGKASAGQQEDTNVYDIPVEASYILGDPNAPVTIVEFSDLQCPYCSKFHTPLMEAFTAFPGQVKIIFKNFPLPMHPHARSAAKAAFAAGVQGKYYEMIGKILEFQSEMIEEKYEEKYEEYAGQLGLNVEQFVKDLKERDEEWEKRIVADEKLVAKVNVEGTPTYFLNGKKNSARTLEAWKKAITEALADKQKK